MGQIGANRAIAYYRLTTDDLISIIYCKRAMIDSENCLVTALFLCSICQKNNLLYSGSRANIHIPKNYIYTEV